MESRSDIVDLFWEDLRGFLASTGYRQRKFCIDYRFNRNLFSDLAQGKTPSLKTIEKGYNIMREAGYQTMRDCRDDLALAAVQGGPEELNAAAEELRACYARAHSD